MGDRRWGPPVREHAIGTGNLRIDGISGELWCGGTYVPVSRYRRRVLLLLAWNLGLAVPRHKIALELGGGERPLGPEATRQALVHVRRLFGRFGRPYLESTPGGGLRLVRHPCDQRRWHACPTGACRRCRIGASMRAQWEGGRPARARWDAWEPDHDRFLRESAELLAPHQIAEEISSRFGTPRSRAAVVRRAKELGVALDGRWLTAGRLARLMGVSPKIVLRWIADGLLRPVVRTRTGDYRRRMLPLAQVRDFLRAHTWAYDWVVMEPGELRNVAQVAAAGERWLYARQVAPLVGRVPKVIVEWLGGGLVPDARRRYGIGLSGWQWVVPARAIPAMRQLAREMDARVAAGGEAGRRVVLERRALGRAS